MSGKWILAAGSLLLATVAQADITVNFAGSGWGRESVWLLTVPGDTITSAELAVSGSYELYKYADFDYAVETVSFSCSMGLSYTPSGSCNGAGGGWLGLYGASMAAPAPSDPDWSWVASSYLPVASDSLLVHHDYWDGYYATTNIIDSCLADGWLHCEAKPGSIQLSLVATTLGGASDGNLKQLYVGQSVPEPASWALLIAGFGVVGLAARRRELVRV